MHKWNHYDSLDEERSSGQTNLCSNHIVMICIIVVRLVLRRSFGLQQITNAAASSALC